MLLNSRDMIASTRPIDLTRDDASSRQPWTSRLKIKTRGATFTANRFGVYETHKRKRQDTIQSSQKRPRLESTRKSIHYDAVYQNGRAVKKHIIVRAPGDISRPGRYYIIRCDQHDTIFEDNPVQAAMAHVWAEHKSVEASYDSVIDFLGCEVIGCDDEKLEENNSAARTAFERGDEQPAGDNIRVRSLPSPEPQQVKKSNVQSSRDGRIKSRRTTRSKRHSGQRSGSSKVLDLVPGNVYIIYWTESKQWFAGVLLPLQDLEFIGIYDSIEKTGLLNNLPDCYQYDTSSMSFSWAKDYEDGGPRSLERHFAFVFFEGVKFPQESHVAWIPLDDIQEWDEQKAQMIEHSQQALDYLKNCKANKLRELTSNDEIRDSADDSEDDPSLMRPQSPWQESTEKLPTQSNGPVTPETAEEPGSIEQKEVEDETSEAEEIHPEQDSLEENDQDVLMVTEEDTAEEERMVPLQKDSEENDDSVHEREEEDNDTILSTQQDTVENVTESSTPNELDKNTDLNQQLEQTVVMNTQEDEAESQLQRNGLEGDIAPTQMDEMDEMDEQLVPETQQDEAETISEQSQPEEAHNALDESDQEMILDVQNDLSNATTQINTPEESADETGDADEILPSLFIDSPKHTTEGLAQQNDTDDETEESAQKSMQPKPDLDRSLSIDIENLLSEGMDLEIHMSQSEQSGIPDSPPVSSSVTQVSFSPLITSRDDAQTQRPLNCSESPCDETPRQQIKYVEMGQKGPLQSRYIPFSSQERTVRPHIEANTASTEPAVSNSSVGDSETQQHQQEAPEQTLAPVPCTQNSYFQPTAEDTTPAPQPPSADIPLRSRTPWRPETASTLLPSMVSSDTGAIAAQPSPSTSSSTSTSTSPHQPPVNIFQSNAELSQTPYTQDAKAHYRDAKNTSVRSSVIPRNSQTILEPPQQPVSHRDLKDSIAPASPPLPPQRLTATESPWPNDPHRDFSASQPLPSLRLSAEGANGALVPEVMASPPKPNTSLSRPAPAISHPSVPRITSSSESSPAHLPRNISGESSSRPIPPPYQSRTPLPDFAPLNHPVSQPMSPPQRHAVARSEIAASYRPASQAMSSPRQLATKIPQRSSIVQNQTVPQTGASPRIAAMSISSPDSVILCPPANQQPQLSSPRQLAMTLSRPGSAVQGIATPQIMPSPRLSAPEVLQRNSITRSPPYSRQMVSSYPHAMELPRPNPSVYERSEPYMVDSLGEVAVVISRPDSTVQYSVSRVGESPRLAEIDSIRSSPFDYRQQPPLMASPRQVPMANHQSGYVMQGNMTPPFRESPQAVMEPPLPSPTLYGLIASPRQMASGIARPSSAMQGYPASRAIASPRQAPMNLSRPNTSHDQVPPQAVASPYQARSSLPRSSVSRDMSNTPNAMSPRLSQTEFQKPLSGMSQRSSFNGSLPPPVPSANNYIPTAPEAHRFSKPRQEPVLNAHEPRRQSSSAAPSHVQPYHYQNPSHAVESTPRSYQPAYQPAYQPVYQPATAKNFNISPTPLLLSLPPHIADLLLQRTGYTRLNHPDYQPSDFINYEGQYQCPFCRMRMSKAGNFIHHLQKLCPSTDRLPQARKTKAVRR
ncbi:hypothetical protein FGRMN_1689 [Fusarium graminum]|nr:hypothetical protein FGRMN_1689 [Fusarium graminum]